MHCAMKRNQMTLRLLMMLFLGLIYWGCESVKPIQGVEVIPLLEKDLSIRAIEVVNKDQIWFAANKGTVGVYNGKEFSQIVLHHKDRLLHFRAIAHNGVDAFALTIDNPALLYRLTFDGNQITSAKLVYQEHGDGVFYDAIGFWNEDEGIAVGDPTDGCLSLIVTRDGGNNWTKLDCDQLPQTHEGEALFAASNGSMSLKQGMTYIATGGTKARVFESEDKGRTWQVHQTPLMQGQSMRGIFSMDQHNRDELVIYGGDWSNQANNSNNKAYSNDGGMTWQLISPGQGPGYRSSVRFIPGSQARGLIAAGSRGLSVSHNQGDKWTQISDTAIYTLRFLNDTVAYAGGPGYFLQLNFY